MRPVQKIGSRPIFRGSRTYGIIEQQPPFGSFVYWGLAIPIGVIALMLPAFLGVAAWDRWSRFQDHKKGRRHPLTRGMLRPPGHHLAERIASAQFDFASLLFMPPLAGSLLGLLYFASAFFTGQAPGELTAGLYLIPVIFIGLYCAWKAISLFQKIKRLKLGWEGELATAEELNRLTRLGYEVFHDVPAEGFNVDHVVVGPSGLYAIETKARTKQKRGKATSSWRATYDGKKIDFAGFSDAKPIEQATRNAKWLSQWLSAASGEKVSATPVVALPGWYIDRKARPAVRVINSTEAQSMVTSTTSAQLSEEQIKRLAYQLDQRCREIAKDKVKPRSRF